MTRTYSVLMRIEGYSGVYEWKYVSNDRLTNRQLAEAFLSTFEQADYPLSGLRDLQLCDEDGWPVVGCSSAAELRQFLPTLS